MRSEPPVLLIVVAQLLLWFIHIQKKWGRTQFGEKGIDVFKRLSLQIQLQGGTQSMENSLLFLESDPDSKPWGSELLSDVKERMRGSECSSTFALSVEKWEKIRAT